MQMLHKRGSFAEPPPDPAGNEGHHKTMLHSHTWAALKKPQSGREEEAKRSSILARRQTEKALSLNAQLPGELVDCVQRGVALPSLQAGEVPGRN